MATKSVNRAFVIFHFTLAAVLFVLSVQTALGATGVAADASPNWLLFILATAEALSAILFVIPQTTSVGGKALLFILLLAFILHALLADIQLPLLVYAAGTYFVLLKRKTPTALNDDSASQK